MEIYFLSYNGETIGVWEGEPSVRQICEALDDSMCYLDRECIEVAQAISQDGSYKIEFVCEDDEFQLYSQEIMKGEA